jgi:hypothetical protein
MKKLLLTLTAVTLGAAALQAQTRLSLYEEFSGENCGPCAAYNPGLWTLLSANTNKILLIKYQSPIPSAGPIYNAYKTITNARMTYYGTPFAPYGVQNGDEVTGNIASYTQSNIDASVANTAPFAISVNHQWSAAGDSVYANITITTPNAFTAPTGANLKLRVALIEHLDYCTAPGTNGETEFHNVVREMYPDATGTSISSTWTASQTQNIKIGGLVPNRVDKSNDRAVIVVWIQDDNTTGKNGHIYQAAQSTKVALATDASIKACTVPVLSCATSSVSVPTSVVLTNTGANPLTSANIYYKVDNGAFATATWTGSIAPGSNATVTIPSVSLSVGAHTITDSVVSINGAGDINTANNAAVVKITVRDASPATLPVATGFENGGTMPTNWTLYDEDGNGANWMLKANAGSNSVYSLLYLNYGFAPGEVNTAILPGNLASMGTHALDFQLAYAQYSNEDDKLDVVYSTDCGVTWTSVWSDHGASMATHAPVGNNVQFVPVEGDWRNKSIDVSSVPANALIGFRATSDYGNNLYIDNVNLRDGAAVGVHNVAAAAQEVKLYPNPAVESTTLQFSLAKAGKVQVSVLDATGRTLSVIADQNMKAGAQRFNISTSSLAAGMYQVVIRGEEGTTTQRLSVVK